MKQLILASNNVGKIKELNQHFLNQSIEIIAQGTLGISEAEETGTTFIENALLKARHASKLSGKPALADDSGLVVPALAGEPGIYSARYSGNHGDDQANNDKLLANLTGITQREAYFVCVIAYLSHAHDPLPIIATGLWHGTIAHKPHGENGFGYDPIFLPDSGTRTAAQLSAAEKSRLSHRAQALASFIKQYQQRQ